jgi:hypothetical protein
MDWLRAILKIVNDAVQYMLIIKVFLLKKKKVLK